ncbi:MAG TPA: hypothetical protein VEC36_12750 [Patescibacteria group bacterium]|nr:hypothetical protein [Patescibacteria group bacterium]
MATIQLPSDVEIIIDNGRAICSICRVERIANAFLKTMARNHKLSDDSVTAAKLTKLIGGKIICQ